jgi:pimeloyl-ACP methyl ester carboxylesterase
MTAFISRRVERIVALDIDGSRQRARIRAAREGLPPLLVVQAGPGLPLLNEIGKFQQRLELEDDFTVAYWDQRGCGNAPLRDAQSVSLRTQVDDVCAAIRWLARETGQRVVVFGVSLGATFALQAAAREAGSIKALVAVSIDTDIAAGDAAASDFLHQAATRADNPGIARLVAKLPPPPYMDPKPLQQRARLLTDLGGIENVKGFGELLRGLLVSLVRTYGVFGTLSTLRNMNAIQAKLLPELATFDLFANWPRPAVPVHYVFGSDDALVSQPLVQKVSGMMAKDDTLVVVHGARHMVHFDAPAAVRSVVVQAASRA